MLKGLILRLISRKRTNNFSTEKENEKHYLGRISVHNANMFKNGHRVVTVAGIGTIIRSIKNDEVITSLRRNQMRRQDKKENLLQYYVFNEKLKRMLPLNFGDYDYVLEGNQPIIYRITNRGFAKIIPSDKNFYDFAKTVNKTKNGIKIYQELKRKGYVLTKRT